MQDFFNSRGVIQVGEKNYTLFRLDALEKAGLTRLERLPFSIRILLEAALRQCNEKEIKRIDVLNIGAWKSFSTSSSNKNQVLLTRPGIPFLPARVIMQDFTGVPA